MFVMTAATQFPQAAQATRLGIVTQGLPSEGAEVCPKQGDDGWTDWWLTPDHPHLRGGDMLDFYHRYISLDKNEGEPLTLSFAQGARFAVSRARIQKRPRNYYSRLLALLAKDVNPQEGFWMEAAWYDVFHPDSLQSKTPLCLLPVAREAIMSLGPYVFDSVRQRVNKAAGDACSDCAAQVDARRLYYGMYGVSSTTVTTTASTHTLPENLCLFDIEPMTAYSWDPRCNDAGVDHVGCNADAVHPECRFCGVDPYLPCPVCEFKGQPTTPYAWDVKCKPGVYTKGCYADGMHFECRFCGEADFDACPLTATMTATSTTATATTTTAASATATSTASSLRGSEESSGSTKLTATFVFVLSAIVACSGLCIGL